MISYNNSPLDFNFRDAGMTFESGNSVSHQRSSSGEFSQIRPYVIGESSLRIDAKRSRFDVNQLIVREYLSEKDFCLTVVLVIAPELRYGTIEYTKFELLRELFMQLFHSIRFHEYTMKIYLVHRNGIDVVDLPRTYNEEGEFFQLIHKIVFTTNLDVPIELQYSALESAFHENKEGGLILIGSDSCDQKLESLRRNTPLQIARIDIFHSDEIESSTSHTLDGHNDDITPNNDINSDTVVTRSFGVYGIISSSNTLWMQLQKIFLIW